jgi:uncharacterized BrkB/YihY/UPF0761 family membrane protein
MTGRFQPLVARVDRWQQASRPVGFAYAVVRKFGDDRGSALAGLVAFYGLAFALHGDPSLQHQIQSSALREVPLVGPDLLTGRLSGNGLGLAVGLAGLLWGALGVTQAIQFAVNQAWAIPNDRRAGFVRRVVRGLALLALLAAGVVGATVLSLIGTLTGNSLLAGGLGLAGGVLVNVGVFLATFKLLSPGGVGWSAVLPGAVFAGVGWQLLETVGQSLVRHNLKHMSQLYGQFALVLGLISFLSIAARVVMYAVEINVVRRDNLWPRSISGPGTATVPADG